MTETRSDANSFESPTQPHLDELAPHEPENGTTNLTNPTPHSPSGVTVDKEPGVVRIDAGGRWRGINVSELWRHRELIGFLALRDIKVRYKQTVLGVGWAIFQPLMLMAVFGLVLGRVVGTAVNDGPPYLVFVYCGILPWLLFAGLLTAVSDSVIKSERLVTKIYFPRLTIPLAAGGPALADSLISFGLLLVLMLFNGLVPQWSMFLLPLPVLAITAAGFGIGSALAALNASFRDFRYVVPFMVQIWMLATPSIYMDLDDRLKTAPSSVQAPDKPNPSPTQTTAENPAKPQEQPPARGVASRFSPNLLWALQANPMVAQISTFRAFCLGKSPNWTAFGLSSLFCGGLFLSGALYFRKAEDRFADVI